MAFVAKHLPDKFHLEGDQRVSLRNKIFREVAANLIVHREYTNAAPCTLFINSDRLETENANNPHGEGPIDPNNFAPFPKNPAIAKFFMQLGRVEELGSGVLNASRLVKEYAGRGKALFIEGSTFKTIIPVPDEKVQASDTVYNTVDDTVNDTVNDTVKGRLAKIILFIAEKPGMKKQELAGKLNVSEVTIKRDMQKIKELVLFKGTQKTGGYFLTDYRQSKLGKK